MSEIIIKDGTGADRYYQTIEDGTLANPFQSVVPSYRVAHAEEVIFGTYGDRVSTWRKAKNLIKFGGNDDLDIGIKETIWNTGGNEVLKTTNSIDTIVSTNAGDTQNVKIEGHTISGGLLTFSVQTVTLNGTTPVTLTTPLARCTRAYNDGSTNFAGDITITDSVAVTTHLTIKGTIGQNQGRKAQTAISATDYFVVTQLSGGLIGSTNARVSFEFQIAEVGKVWRTIREYLTTTYIEVPLDPPIIVPKNHDVRVIGLSDTNNTGAVAEFSGYLAEVVV